MKSRFAAMQKSRFISGPEYAFALSRQLCSALSSSVGQDLSSACAAHSGSEAMNLRSLPLLGLECHFHSPGSPPTLNIINTVRSHTIRTDVPCYYMKKEKLLSTGYLVFSPQDIVADVPVLQGHMGNGF